jgi:hypothetical protein
MTRRSATQASAAGSGGPSDEIRAWLKSAASIAKTAIGSIAKSLPGGEVIMEALEGILSGFDLTDAIATSAE